MEGIGFVSLAGGVRVVRGARRSCDAVRERRLGEKTGRARRVVLASAADDTTAKGSEIEATASSAAESSEAVAPAPKSIDSLQARLRVGLFIALWYAFNIVYNITNKQVLNVYPYPWFVSWAQLVVGACYALLLWALRLRKMPTMDSKFLKSLVPVAIFHDVGHVATVVSLGAVAVSFTHVVKAMEPFINVIASAAIMGSVFPIPVYLSLVPVVGGVIMASVTEVSFTMMGFLSAMTSNFAFVGRNIYSKLGMQSSTDKNMNGANLFSVMSIIAVLILAPFPFIFEGLSMFSGWTAATTGAGAVISHGKLLQTLLLSGLFFQMYQEVAFLALDNVHPVTHSVANTVKRVVIIVTSIFVFRNPVTQANAIGSAIAICGVLLYSLVKNYYAQKKE